MKLQKIDLSHLRNDEHFQFFTEFRDVVLKLGATNLKIETQFETFQNLYAQEDEVLKKIMKSAITAEIERTDGGTNTTFGSVVGEIRIGGGTHNNKNGRNITAAEAKAQATYTSLGWPYGK